MSDSQYSYYCVQRCNHHSCYKYGGAIRSYYYWLCPESKNEHLYRRGKGQESGICLITSHHILLIIFLDQLGLYSRGSIICWYKLMILNTALKHRTELFCSGSV